MKDVGFTILPRSWIYFFPLVLVCVISTLCPSTTSGFSPFGTSKVVPNWRRSPFFQCSDSCFDFKDAKHVSIMATRNSHDEDDLLVSAAKATSTEDLSDNSTHVDFINKVLKECGYQSMRPTDPNLATFHWLLKRMMKARLLRAERKAVLAKSILTYILDGLSASRRRDWIPNVYTLNLVLSAHGIKRQRQTAVSNQDAVCQEAMDLFYNWRDWYKQGIVWNDVNLISYNKLMTVLSRSSKLTEAEKLFEEMQVRAKTDSSLTPDVVTFGGLLFAHALAGHTEKVTSLLDNMLSDGPTPTIMSFNDVLYAYSMSETPQKAFDFFRWWEANHVKDGDSKVVKPDCRSYNVVLNTMSRSAFSNNYQIARKFFDSIPIQKDDATYATMISICSKNLPGPAALHAVDDILQQAESDSSVAIDNPFVTKVLYSLSAINEPSSPLLADKLVTKHCPSPNLFVYEALVHCWSKSTDPNAARRAIEILETVENDNTISPTVKLYTNVIDALKTQPGQESLETMDKILTKMETTGPYPNVATYSAAIGCISRSRLHNRAAVALDVLRRMKVPPNIVVYNSVLNVCEYSPPESSVSMESVRIACDVFMRARKDENVQLSHITFGCFIATIGRLMTPSDQRTNLILQVFKQCCLEGQVSSYVIQKLKISLISKALLRTAFDGHTEDDLPDAWTKNVKNVPARLQH